MGVLQCTWNCTVTFMDMYRSRIPFCCKQKLLKSNVRVEKSSFSHVILVYPQQSCRDKQAKTGQNRDLVKDDLRGSAWSWHVRCPPLIFWLPEGWLADDASESYSWNKASGKNLSSVWKPNAIDGDGSWKQCVATYARRMKRLRVCTLQGLDDQQTLIIKSHYRSSCHFSHVHGFNQMRDWRLCITGGGMLVRKLLLCSEFMKSPTFESSRRCSGSLLHQKEGKRLCCGAGAW